MNALRAASSTPHPVNDDDGKPALSERSPAPGAELYDEEPNGRGNSRSLEPPFPFYYMYIYTGQAIALVLLSQVLCFTKTAGMTKDPWQLVVCSTTLAQKIGPTRARLHQDQCFATSQAEAVSIHFSQDLKIVEVITGPWQLVVCSTMMAQKIEPGSARLHQAQCFTRMTTKQEMVITTITVVLGDH